MFEAVSQCIAFGGGTQLTVLGESPPCPLFGMQGTISGDASLLSFWTWAEAEGPWGLHSWPLSLPLVPPLVHSVWCLLGGVGDQPQIP